MLVAIQMVNIRKLAPFMEEHCLAVSKAVMQPKDAGPSHGMEINV